MPRKYDTRLILERQKASHRKWLQNPGNLAMRANANEHIEEDIHSNSAGSLVNLSHDLISLGLWYGTCGEVALLDGNALGWQEIHRSWLCLSLAMRMRIAVFQKGRVLGQFRPVRSLANAASLSALCLAYAIMVHRDFETNFFGDAVRTMLIDKEVVREGYWQYHPVEPFTIQLLALSRSERLDVPKEFGRSLRVYQGIFDAWAEPPALARTINEACNFHCERIEDKSDDFFADFRSPPFDLVPAEILAIYSVRQALGLETPTVDHPLLQPPFNTPVGNPSEIEDELLDRVEAKI